MTHEDDDEEGSCPVFDDNTQHCAGALIFALRLRQPSQMMRIVQRLGMLDEDKLMASQHLVFANFAAWLKHLISPHACDLNNVVDSGPKKSTMQFE